MTFFVGEDVRPPEITVDEVVAVKPVQTAFQLLENLIRERPHL